MRLALLPILLVSIPILALSENLPGYYRFPAIHGDTVVFTSEGDLWEVPAEGGTARRLTSHLGVESHAAISPDGSTIAYSAQYEGPTEVYTIPVNGGLPTRLTHDGESAIVVGWTPDGKILYSTRHYSTLPNTQLVLLDPKTGSRDLVPLSQAAEGTFDESGKTIIFTRLPFQGSHTKRYKGGTAQNIWKYTTGAAEAVPLTQDYPGTSKTPMWWNGRIYFVSDRDGTMNLWSMNESGGDLRQLTKHQGSDVKSPSLDAGRIVYQLGADLRIFDIAAAADRQIPIALTSDFDQMREKWVKDPMQYLSSAHLSPSGDRVTLTSRGRIFVAPAQTGRFVEVTRKEGVRYRDARFFPGGKKLVFISDESGEMEFWTSAANGTDNPARLTTDGKVFRYEGLPSPDGKWIATTDKNQNLWLIDAATGKAKHVAFSEEDNFSDLAWSPDSRWLAYVTAAANSYRQVDLYHPDDASIHIITDDRTDSYSPAWSSDGKWLYFLSDRFFTSEVGAPWGPRQPEPYFDKTTKIYALSLLKDGRSPFAPADELHETAETSKQKEKTAEGKKTEPSKTVTVQIDLDGLGGRLWEVPVPAGNYSNISMNEKYLYFTETDQSLEPKTKLTALEIKNTDVKPQTILEDIAGYELSGDGKKIMVQKKDAILVFDAGGDAPKSPEKAQVDLKNWTFPVQPREEWRQMFVDAWRLERDYFYDPNLHGLDWKGLLDKHLPLVARVADRDELDDLIGDLVGELSALHIFVVGGDKRKGADQITVASLGADLVRDGNAGGYRIRRIYRSDPDYPEGLSPLSKPGTGIGEGDVLLAINGAPALGEPDIGTLLDNQAGKQVLVRVHSALTGKTFDAIVLPIAPGAAAGLRYDDWELREREMTEKLGGGDIGYVHLRAMGRDSYSEWVRNFYPVYQRSGLIIDVRNNSGGNIDSWILEKLLRKAWFFWKGRLGKPFANMQYAYRGHVVVICNEWTASDGEAFTEGFRRLGLGKVIGTRTWGGEIWLSFDNWLVDKGIASAAESGVYGPERHWLIEGHGVDPDIVVDNLPHATFEGQDAQLEAAINTLKDEIKTSPVAMPAPPPYPNKSAGEK